MAEDHIAQSQPFDDCVVPVQKQNGDNRFRLSYDQPSMSNICFGLNPNKSMEPEITSSINPNNVVINETLKHPNLEEMALTEVVLDRCEGSATADTLVSDDSRKQGPDQINEAHASHAPSRVLKQEGQKRILPTWTRRGRPPTQEVAASSDYCSGKKRERRDSEDHSELPPKRFQASQNEEGVSILLVEADHQPRQNQ